MSITELARVIGVERPTIYAWMRAESEPHEANYRRLARVAALARKYGRFSPLGARVRRPGADGTSLVDLLAEEPLPEERIEQRLLSEWTDMRLEGGRRAVVPAIRSARDAAIALGIPAARGSLGQAAVDQLTGQPIGEDPV
jgi:transcriptional regulator with XRE-family HTH domain